ncbi:MAG: RHS repeat-associated core domain-containing protein [Lewinellaceae bacterium]|nr:RHS repeat-associated core domain-containing protein [Phaeodactylibacter sp.]MCB9041520.1 RHS repeat-associated core domain-containing protein [Lewinellaceae bacterium]
MERSGSPERSFGKNKYLYNGKELSADYEINLSEYGARWYDPAVGRFTGVDPIAAQFAWVSTYNYAENEPVGHIDLWGLQKYKPKMQSIDRPSDLISTKMVNNAKEGIKTVAIEAGSIIGEGVNRLGKWIEETLPNEGSPDGGAFEDESFTHDGSGIEVLSDTKLNANGTLALPDAKEGSTAIIDMGEINLYPYRVDYFIL